MITILGGGIGGLTLAAILQRNGVDCIVYDADLSVDARHQGGMLNINEGPAHDALIAAGAYEAFLAHVLQGGDALKLMNRAGEVLIDMTGDGTRPEIDRGSLRRILVDALPPGVVQWGAKVTQGQRRGDAIALSFADGRVEQTDLLIGADGAWSKVRPLLTDARPAYCGITFVEFRYLNAGQNWPQVKALVGDGLLFALSEGRGIIGHREPADEICIYAAAQVAEDHFPAQPDRAAVMAAFQGWNPDVVRVLQASDGPIVSRPLYALPIGLRWDSQPGVTLLGDAAHVMSPFAGEGVNLAMIDAGDLAAALLANPDNSAAAIKSYETGMFPRAQQLATESMRGLEMAFAPDAPKPYLDFFASMAEHAPGK